MAEIGMDVAGYINGRKARYMAQLLEAIEEGYVGLLGDEHSDAIERYRNQRVLAGAVEYSDDEAEPRRRSDFEREQGRKAFDDHILPLLPTGAGQAIDQAKGIARARMKALATDAIDVLTLDGREINGAAQQLRDKLHIDRPQGVPTA